MANLPETFFSALLEKGIIRGEKAGVGLAGWQVDEQGRSPGCSACFLFCESLFNLETA